MASASGRREHQHRNGSVRAAGYGSRCRPSAVQTGPMFWPVADIRASRRPVMTPPDGTGAEQVSRGICDEAEDVTAELPTAGSSMVEPWPVMDPAAYHGLAGDV